MTPPPVVMEVCDIVPAFEATTATGFCMIVPRTRSVYRTVICQMKNEQAVPKMLISMESAELWNVAGFPD